MPYCLADDALLEIVCLSAENSADTIQYVRRIRNLDLCLSLLYRFIRLYDDIQEVIDVLTRMRADSLSQQWQQLTKNEEEANNGGRDNADHSSKLLSSVEGLLKRMHLMRDIVVADNKRNWSSWQVSCCSLLLFSLL